MAEQQTHQHHHRPNQQQQPQQIQQRQAVDIRIPAIEKYAYCLCLHVKPTTIFIAVFKLIRALLTASHILNAEFPTSDQIDNDLHFAMIDDRQKATLAAEHLLTRMVVASVSAVGIYAVISGRAALLMPLYAMLLVDFFFALPAFYSRDMETSFGDTFRDLKNYGNAGPSQYNRYSFVLFTTTTMILKIYFLCVIWKCYRYLRLIELVSPIRITEIYPHIQSANGSQYPAVRVLGSTDSTDYGSYSHMAPPPYESITSTMKPPNYEEAIKTTASATAPQSGQTSADSQPQQTIVSTDPLADQPQQPQTTLTQVISHPNPRAD